jgi:hypothetical protein
LTCLPHCIVKPKRIVLFTVVVNLNPSLLLLILLLKLEVLILKLLQLLLIMLLKTEVLLLELLDLLLKLLYLLLKLLHLRARLYRGREEVVNVVLEMGGALGRKWRDVSCHHRQGLVDED